MMVLYWNNENEKVVYGYGNDGFEVAKSLDDPEIWCGRFEDVKPYLEKLKEDGDLCEFLDSLRLNYDFGMQLDEMTQECFEYILSKDGGIYANSLDHKRVGYQTEPYCCFYLLEEEEEN